MHLYIYQISLFLILLVAIVLLFLTILDFDCILDAVPAQIWAFLEFLKEHSVTFGLKKAWATTVGP